MNKVHEHSISCVNLNMKAKKPIVSTILLHFALLISCCEAEEFNNDTVQVAPESVCENGICYITSENFTDLQAMVRSNRIIVLDGEQFTVKENTVVSIDFVSNLTIKGQEGSTTVLHCSQKTSFALNFSSNAAHVTVTGLKIENCGATIEYLVQDSLCDFGECPPPKHRQVKTSFHIDGSTNITLSGVHFENSLGYAVSTIVGVILEYEDYNFEDCF